METEYRGEPVAGGTFPAEIWHDFMVNANKIRASRWDKDDKGTTGPDRSHRRAHAGPAHDHRGRGHAGEDQAQEARGQGPGGWS